MKSEIEIMASNKFVNLLYLCDRFICAIIDTAYVLCGEIYCYQPLSGRDKKLCQMQIRPLSHNDMSNATV